MVSAYILIFYYTIGIGFLWLLRTQSRAERIIKLIIFLLVPVFGFFLLIGFQSMLHRRAVIEEFKEIETPREPMSSFTLRRLNVQSEIDIVPLEEALIVNDVITKRRMLLNALKDKTVRQNSILETALMNEDTETSHYAAIALIEMKNELQITLQQFTVQYEEMKLDEQMLKNYAQVMKSYINSGFLDETALQENTQRYQQLLEEIASFNKVEEIYFVELIELLIDQRELLKAENYCDQYQKNYPNFEKPYVLYNKINFYKGDKEKFYGSLEKLRLSPNPLSNEALQLIRFWAKGV
jgi:hypothetical protein